GTISTKGRGIGRSRSELRAFNECRSLILDAAVIHRSDCAGGSRRRYGYTPVGAPVHRGAGRVAAQQRRRPLQHRDLEKRTRRLVEYYARDELLQGRGTLRGGGQCALRPRSARLV